MHNMTDQELFLKASMVQGIEDFTNKTIPKVAFMFLVKGKLPLAPLWEKFFEGHAGFYSIYLHQDPSYHDNVREDSVFYGRKVPSQVRLLKLILGFLKSDPKLRSQRCEFFPAIMHNDTKLNITTTTTII